MKTYKYTVIYIAAAIAFLTLLVMDVSGIVRTLLKAIPVSTLTVLVLRETRGFARIGLSGALIGSVCGDVLLDLPSGGFFIFGLVSFLVGHLFYATLFFRFAQRPDGLEKTAIVCLLMFAAVMMWLFRDIEPGLYLPVVIYIVVIVAMSIGALLVPASNRLLFWGALLFILSDVILAINKFLVVIPYGRMLNISIYFIAQYTLIRSAVSIWGPERSLILENHISGAENN